MLQADIAFKNTFIGFLAFDDEHHRIAIVRPPNVSAPAQNMSGLDHIAFTYASPADLIATYERLKGAGTAASLSRSESITMFRPALPSKPDRDLPPTHSG